MQTYSQAELDHAVAAERARFGAVLSSAAFKGRETSACHMLENTHMTAEQVIGALSGLAGPVGDLELGKAIAAGLPKEMRRAE